MASQRQKTERFIWGLFLDVVIPEKPDRGRRQGRPGAMTRTEFLFSSVVTTDLGGK